MKTKKREKLTISDFGSIFESNSTGVTAESSAFSVVALKKLSNASIDERCRGGTLSIIDDDVEATDDCFNMSSILSCPHGSLNMFRVFVAVSVCFLAFGFGRGSGKNLRRLFNCWCKSKLTRADEVVGASSSSLSVSKPKYFSAAFFGEVLFVGEELFVLKSCDVLCEELAVFI